MCTNPEFSQERSDQLVAAAELRHVATMLDMEQVPRLSTLAVEQVRVVIGFLQQQASGLMNTERSERQAGGTP